MSLIGRISLYAALMLSAAASHAAGLRGVELGDPCGMASDIEFRLGSSLVRSDGSVPLLHYHGTYSGKDADIVYICDNHILADQVIMIRTSDRDAAFQTAGEIKESVIKEFGAPSYDGLGLNYAEKLWRSLWGVSGDVMLQSAIWQVQGREVFLWVRNDEKDGWEIRLSQSSHIDMIADAYRGIN